MHVKWGCFCVDDWIALPNLNEEAYVEAIHATHYAGGLQILLVAVIAQQSCLQDSRAKSLHLSESKLETKKAIFKMGTFGIVQSYQWKISDVLEGQYRKKRPKNCIS